MVARPLQHEGYNLIGAAFDVYDELGNGYLEEVYHECLERELTARSIPWESKRLICLFCKGAPLLRRYYPDLLVYADIVTELKAVRPLAPEHEAQLLD